MEEEQELEQLDLQTLRSRTKDLSDILSASNNDSSEESLSELKAFLEDLKSRRVIDQVGFSDFDSLQPDDLEDAHMQEAMEQLNLVEAENSKIHEEINAITSTYVEDYIRLERDLEGLNCSLKVLESRVSVSKGLDKFEFEASAKGSASLNGSLVNQQETYNFELLELDHQIEKRNTILSSLEDLDDVLKRSEAVGQIEDVLTGLKVLEFDGNKIRLSLKTFIPPLDDFSKKKMEFSENPSTVSHKLSIEVYDGTMVLQKVEIVPNDVYIDNVVDEVNSSWKLFFSLPFQGVTSSLQCLVQKVQDRISLCSLRRLVVEDANMSRLNLKDANTPRDPFEYSDKDGTVTAHMEGGIDAVIKLPYGWPLVKSTLKLISLNRANNCTYPLLTSCKAEELGSSLDVQTQQNLLSFVDAIEKILPQQT